MPRSLAFVMDPIDRINPAGDTSFALMLAGRARGFRIFHADPHAVGVEGGQVHLGGRFVSVRDAASDFCTVESEERLAATDCDAIFIRTDPPFDEDYLNTTLLLSLAEAAGVRVVNSPRGLREANEHLYALVFPELCPETVVSSSPRLLREFVGRVGGAAIGKPINGHAGQGVVRLTEGDTNLPVLLDNLTREGTAPTMVQAFVPEGAESDRRLFIIGGELRAVLRRVVAAGDHRANIHVGARAERVEANDADRAIAAAMRERLLADGLWFVGADVVGDRLIEVNVTSPTLVRELAALGGPDLAAEMIASIEAAGAASA